RAWAGWRDGSTPGGSTAEPGYIRSDMTRRSDAVGAIRGSISPTKKAAPAHRGPRRRSELRRLLPRSDVVLDDELAPADLAPDVQGIQHVNHDLVLAVGQFRGVVGDLEADERSRDARIILGHVRPVDVVVGLHHDLSVDIDLNAVFDAAGRVDAV